MGFAWVDPLVQRTVLRGSYAWHRVIRRRPHVGWVVGPLEIAGLVRCIVDALPSSISALLASHSFYDHAYDWVAPARRLHLARLVQGPWKLGELAARADGFVYVSGTGYLNAMNDGCRHEFAFLKRRGKRIVCYFSGNDIRSPRRSAAYEAETGQPNIATYLSETNPVFATDAYEEQRRAIAASADAYADLVFNADGDQRGYLTRPTEPFLYFFPDEEITEDFSKFSGIDVPVIIHAPSSPVVKGTQLVRAAIAELRDEGYEFEYVELVRRPHAEVRELLHRAHIVLNQFYADAPGVFGIEAMAAGSVVLMSADEHREPILPPGSNEAWVVTKHHQVTKHLRALLDDPGSWEPQARAGAEWVRAHAAAGVTGAMLREKLARLG